MRSRNHCVCWQLCCWLPPAATQSASAEETAIPQPSVSREVSNVIATSVLTASADRRRKVMQANTDSATCPDLASLLLKTVDRKVALQTCVGERAAHR